MIMPNNKCRIVTSKARRGSPEEKQFNIDFWRKFSTGAKLVAAWEMVGEIAWFKEQTHGGESRLQRSVEHIERRKR
ncbi:MAG: hypothetical protein KKC28_13935 [Verrucomicrobia bacterium]|nr:hypothetical protein [Verrucomicrobiota bacterium]MBU1858077.1 hypothetical protein [Verrucomicrobiota bacterium]